MCAYAFPVVGAQSWRMAAWDDEDCFKLQSLRWWVEVHHKSRQMALAAT